MLLSFELSQLNHKWPALLALPEPSGIDRQQPYLWVLLQPSSSKAWQRGSRRASCCEKNIRRASKYIHIYMHRDAPSPRNSGKRRFDWCPPLLDIYQAYSCISGVLTNLTDRSQLPNSIEPPACGSGTFTGTPSKFWPLGEWSHVFPCVFLFFGIYKHWKIKMMSLVSNL